MVKWLDELSRIVLRLVEGGLCGFFFDFLEEGCVFVEAFFRVFECELVSSYVSFDHFQDVLHDGFRWRFAGVFDCVVELDHCWLKLFYLWSVDACCELF